MRGKVNKLPEADKCWLLNFFGKLD